MSILFRLRFTILLISFKAPLDSDKSIARTELVPVANRMDKEKWKFHFDLNVSPKAIVDVERAFVLPTCPSHVHT